MDEEQEEGPEVVYAYRGWVSMAFEIVAMDDAIASTVSDIPPTPGPSTTGSASNLGLANSWLAKCLSHPTCSTATPFTLPTRLLDLSAPNSPVLIRTVTLAHQTIHYATLSHCWGLSPPLTTTLSTLPTRQTSIPLSTLPQTFQDATHVARAMGVQYLWIDSLCIIQDSATDWEAEAARMGSYYSHALFNIAAAGASNSSQGCFMQRDPRCVRSCRVRLSFVSETNQDAPNPAPHREKVVWLRPRDDRAVWAQQAAPSALDRRGWVMQERLLAPRTLLFGREQLGWACLEIQADERDPGGRKSQGALRNLGRGDDVLRRVFQGMGLRMGEKGELWERWYDLVRVYSGLEFTYWSDVLPALSGVASLVGDATGWRYLAGLWEEDLQRGLLWSVSMPGARMGDYLAPSWSWASVRRAVTFHDFEDPNNDKTWDFECCVIEGVEVDISGQNPFGEVSGGVMRVKGRLKRGFALKEEEIEDGVRESEDDCDNVLDDESVRLVGQYWPDHIEWPEESIFFLPFIHEKGVVYTEERAVPDEKWSATCLALVPCKGKDGVYERVGMARIHDAEWFTNDIISLEIV